MPPLPDASHVLRARIFFTIAGKETQGVRAFFSWSGTTPTTTSLNALAEILHNRFSSGDAAGTWHPSVILTRVVLEDLTSSMAATGEYVANTPGTRAGDPLPADAAFVSSYEITRRYRGGHPRSYWPFGTADDLTTSQTFKPTSVAQFLTTVSTGFAGFVGAAATGTTIAGHVALSYYEGFTAVMNPLTGRYRNVPTLRAAPLVTSVGSVVGRSYVGSFRRRRQRVS